MRPSPPHCRRVVRVHIAVPGQASARFWNHACSHNLTLFGWALRSSLYIFALLSVVLIVAAGLSTDGLRCWALPPAPRKPNPFPAAFLRSRADQGLRGVKLVSPDDYKGLQQPGSSMPRTSAVNRTGGSRRSSPQRVLRRRGSNGPLWLIPCGSAD
jgi:hypothetical protein